MDINFPLILLCLVTAGALIWIVDALWFARHRGPEEKDPALVENAKALTPVLAVVFVIRSFLYEPFQIPSASMEQTLLTGDFILVNKYTYGIRLPVWRTKVLDNNEPERGDVMVFFPPHEDRYFIKRVIGVPGDLVEYRDKVLYINGEEQPQQLIPGPRRALFQQYQETLDGHTHLIQRLVSAPADNFKQQVPPGYYFMMGDNRDRSMDSRRWGMVPEERIVGKAVAIWMHKEPGWNLPSFDRAGGFD